MDRRQLVFTGVGAGAAMMMERIEAADAMLDAKKKPLPLFFKGQFAGGPFNGYILDIAVNQKRVRGFARNQQVTQALRLEQGRFNRNRITLDLFHPNDPCARQRFGSMSGKIKNGVLEGTYAIEDTEASTDGEFTFTAQKLDLDKALMRSLAGTYRATGRDPKEVVIGDARIKLFTDGRYRADEINGQPNCPKRQTGVWGLVDETCICISPTFICYEEIDKELICNSHPLMCPGVLEAPIIPPLGPNVLIHHPFLDFRGDGVLLGRG